MIEIQHINKSFGENHVLKDFSAIFEPGKVNLIIGQSGSGKSVMTKCIVGLMEVDTGSIQYDGLEFTSMTRNERKEIRKQIGMLFQASALFDSLTVEDNIMFPLKMFTNMTKKEMQDRANFCLDRVNLEGRNKLFPAECSGGMQKRIAIARAIAMNPRYLFCDEPNSGLDPSTSIVVDNLIKEITHEYGMTTIVITHDMNSVIEIGENILFLYKGENWWSGTKEEIIRTENQEVIDFVYASQFMRNLKDKLQKEGF
jgi:phospholipid/cholesterol/gamma-HCH transport system ATP-binding protein